MAEKRKKGERIDWEPIETDYIVGNDTLKTLAEQYGISRGVVEQRAWRDEWTKQREDYRYELQREKITASKKDAVEDRERFDKLTDRACDIIAAQIALRLDKAHKEAADTGEFSIPITIMATMIATVKEAQNVKYRRLGIAQPKQTVEFEGKDPFVVYQERLALETVRLMPGNGEGDTGEMVSIPLKKPSKN